MLIYELFEITRILTVGGYPRMNFFLKLNLKKKLEVSVASQ
jgi:hypothetical protein